MRMLPTLDPDAVVRTAVLFVVHDNPPSYEYAIRFVPLPPIASRITPPPTAIRKFREYVCDHVIPSAPFDDRTTTDVVSPPPPGRSPCARPTPARHIAPDPAPTPALDTIPVVNNEIGIFAYATAFVFKVGEYKPFVALFHDDAAVISVELTIREAPAPQDALQEYPVHAIPFNLENVGSVNVLSLAGVFHSIEPVRLVV